MNPMAQLDAAYAAQRAAGKREAARTRKKLLEFASELGGESESGESCVVKLEARQGQEEPNPQSHTNSISSAERRKKKEEEGSGQERNESAVSDWA
jgi:hypothetical protein